MTLLAVRWLRSALRRPGVREAALGAAHAAEARTVLAWDADLAIKHSQAVSLVLASLAQTRDALVHIGPFLIVKSDWTVAVHQLTPAQQYELEHLPAPARTAQQTLAVLGLAVPAAGPDAGGDPED